MNSVILIYLTLSLPLFYILSKLAKNFNLLDKPDKRKLHTGEIPFIGGLGISIFFLLFVKIQNFNHLIDLILIYSFIMSIIGFIDDKYNLNIGGKLALQLFLSFILISKDAHFLIQNLGSYNYFGSINLGELSIFFTILCILFITNAFNYTDGSDGNLGLQILSILILIYLLGNNLNLDFTEVENLITSLSVILFVFLIFNLSIFNFPKIFLGDSGSMSLGYLIGFFIIYLANEFYIHPAKLIWVIHLISHEFFATTLTRVIKKSGVFVAGNDHIHYILRKILKNNLQIIILLFFYNTAVGIFGFFIFEKFGPITSLISFITLFLLYFKMRLKLVSK